MAWSTTHNLIGTHPNRHKPTHHIHSNPWPDHHATPRHPTIIMPHHATELAVPSTTSSEPPTIGSLSIGLQWWVLLFGLFDLGWVLRFVNVVGCRLVVAVVLWLWRQFGGCGGDYWVVVVVIFWVVIVVVSWWWLEFLRWWWVFL